MAHLIEWCRSSHRRIRDLPPTRVQPWDQTQARLLRILHKHALLAAVLVPGLVLVGVPAHSQTGTDDVHVQPRQAEQDQRHETQQGYFSFRRHVAVLAAGRSMRHRTQITEG